MTTLTFHNAPGARRVTPTLRSIRTGLANVATWSLALLQHIGKGVLAVVPFALLAVVIMWLRIAHFMPAIWR